MPQSKQQKRKKAMAARRNDILKHMARPKSDLEKPELKDAITQRILAEIANI